MNDPSADWERRLQHLLASIDSHDAPSFVDKIDQLATELPENDPVGLFERGGARDSTGDPINAITLYKAALDACLQGSRRRRAIIQMASSLRNLGRAEESVSLLSHELLGEKDDLTGAVRTFLALALVDAGRAREAVSVAVTALSEYLPRYNVSAARYAKELLEELPPH